MSGIPSEFIYHLVVQNIAPLMASSVASLYTSYSSKKPFNIPIPSEIDEERELDGTQMDRILPWMKMLFDETTPESQKAYKKELYNIYATISTDFRQYQQWKKYNSSLWVFSSYRNKNTKGLARKILADVKLFQEGLKMFSMSHTL